VPWPRGGLRWAFVLIVFCYFFRCDLLCLPSRISPREEGQIPILRHLTQSWDGALNFELKLVEFQLATPSVQLSWKLVCFHEWYRITKKYQKNQSKKCKIWISTSGLTPWWAPLSFRADRAVLFLSLWSAILPRRVWPREEAQVRLLRHLTQTWDGALNFMLKLWNFYRPHLLSNWAENCCAFYLSDIELEKI
jgi:hypothetical protein